MPGERWVRAATAALMESLIKMLWGLIVYTYDQDALGLDRIYVQAKRYSDGNNVGSGAIRDFFGSLDRFKAAKGLFITTSAFSSSARETADFLSKRIVLIDGIQLAKLMIRFNVGCRVEETIELKKVDEEFFE
jgi:restriction system protein